MRQDGSHDSRSRKFCRLRRSGQAANAYDGFAEAYSAETEASLHEWVLRAARDPGLAGEVAGRVLDVGCGSGPIAAALRDRGATVAGFDSSAGMLEVARR